MSKVLVRLIVVALSALALVAPSAQALPSTSHTITQIGTVTTGGFTVSGLSASELGQSGTVVINGTTVTISCVSVLPSGPGLHLAGMFGVDVSGLGWYILVRQPTPVTGVVLVSNNPGATPWCSAGDWPFTSPPNTGTFLITP